MKHSGILLAIAVLVLASLACQALMGGGSNDGNDVPPSNDNGVQSGDVQPTTASDENSNSNDSNENDNSNSNSSSDTGFPMTAHAYDIVEVSDESVVYYTKLSAEEVLEFYRSEYTSRGYTEREIVTSLTEGILNLVFDGDASGKAVVVQSVGLPDGSRTVAIRLEDV